MDIPTNLTDMKELHAELKCVSTELWELSNQGKMSDTGHEIMHELLFNERQGIYSAASRKVARTTEELAAQVDILILEAADDPICIHADDVRHGQMMRSIRAGISGLSEPEGVNVEQFWSDYASLDDDGKKLVRDVAKALRNQSPVLKAAG